MIQGQILPETLAATDANRPTHCMAATPALPNSPVAVEPGQRSHDSPLGDKSLTDHYSHQQCAVGMSNLQRFRSSHELLGP